MSEFMFDVSRQKPRRKTAKTMNQIAKQHDAYLVEATLPGVGYQRWFCGPSRGSPFDQRMSSDVTTDLVRVGILVSIDGGLLLAPTHISRR